MIPKVIHLCWLSGDKYPAAIQRCIDTWHKNLPDYDIWIWDAHRFDLQSSRWVRQAYEAKKYAFAADYIRLYALYNYGGIYLDSDVLIFEDLQEMYNLPFNNNYILGFLDLLNYGVDYLGLNSEKYINAGVLLINLEKIRKDNKCFEMLYMAKNYKKLNNNDQTIIMYFIQILGYYHLNMEYLILILYLISNIYI